MTLPDRGSATIALTGVVAVVAVFAFAIAGLAAEIGAGSRARGVADLAALAAARVARVERAEGQWRSTQPARACEVAARVAARNGGHLDECAAVPCGAVDVAVRVSTRLARSRAGMEWACAGGPDGDSG